MTTEQRLLETIAEDLAAETSYADMLAHPETVVDAFNLLDTFACACSASGDGGRCPFTTDDRAAMIKHYRIEHYWTTSVLPGETRVNNADPPTGEVYVRLAHAQYDPAGVKISHRAGDFGHVRLLMRGAVLFLNRDQTRMLLGQWRRLTQQTGLASGWTIERRYLADQAEPD